MTTYISFTVFCRKQQTSFVEDARGLLRINLQDQVLQGQQQEHHATMSSVDEPVLISTLSTLQKTKAWERCYTTEFLGISRSCSSSTILSYANQLQGRHADKTMTSFACFDHIR